MFAGPFIRIRGEPLLMMNILERKFIIFGRIFWPTDLYLFAIAMVTLFVMIVLFTAVFGRIWCGWLCPQTVLMEGVFRKIEYWIEGDSFQQKALAAAPWTAGKMLRKGLKHAIFFGLSFVIGNVLLSYIIGSEAMLTIIREPVAQHASGFTAMVLFSLLFYGIFARFREQACTFICPYGRFQSVLLDGNSIVVSYDHKRGNPAASYSRDLLHPNARPEQGLGDCINCRLCVEVCPTGIDIRNGTQMECVNCTACIDACNYTMDKIGFPRGLIRYASHNSIAKGDRLRVTPRLVIYTVVLCILSSLLAFLLATRKDVEATMLRAPGTIYQQVGADQFSNLYLVKLLNKTTRDLPVELRLDSPRPGARSPSRAARRWPRRGEGHPVGRGRAVATRAADRQGHAGRGRPLPRRQTTADHQDQLRGTHLLMHKNIWPIGIAAFLLVFAGGLVVFVMRRPAPTGAPGAGGLLRARDHLPATHRARAARRRSEHRRGGPRGPGDRDWSSPCRPRPATAWWRSSGPPMPAWIAVNPTPPGRMAAM
jgi:cytochrome c oxidase accessory protein FixG